MAESWFSLGKWRRGLRSVGYREAVLVGERGGQEGKEFVSLQEMNF